MIWEKTNIRINNKEVSATAPLIISASRATDIPAFFAKEFMQKIRQGYLFKTNPFNGRKELISFKNTRLIIFWTKFPQALMPFLEELNETGINYYFQFTLNDYEKEKLEPFLPPLQKRIDAFIRLSEKIGKEKVIWRFDPVLLLKNQSFENIISRIENIAKQIHLYTEKLVFSFADFSYRKVQNNLRRSGVDYRELSDNEKYKFAEKLVENLKKYTPTISTCAQSIELSALGINHNKCIDDELIVRLFHEDKALMDFIKPYIGTSKLKDKGQRKYCGCIYSKDAGMYNTCSFMCKYCYANTSEKTVHNNKAKIFT
jgi:DNA repair photolyase